MGRDMLSTACAAAVCVQLLARAATAKPFEPRSWDEAQAKALETFQRMDHHERRELLHGSSFECGKSACSTRFAGYTRRIKDKAVPALKMHDAASGFRSPHSAPGTSTCFPSMLALASTWDAELAGAHGKAVGAEFRGKGANVLLGPSVNVHRSALGGQNVESISGEDPQLGARLAGAYIAGVQGSGVMAVAKRFAYGQRLGYDAAVDARTAWELYYPPFEAAVAAGAGGVMCAAGAVNGTVACGNPQLLQRDLREAMGFRGFVVSDWGATLGGLRMGGEKLVQNGLDIEMPSGALLSSQMQWLMDHKATGATQTSFDRAGIRVLTAIYRMRYDEDEGCLGPHGCRTTLESDQTSDAHQQVARAVATDAVVLLANDGLLPLDAKRVRRLAIVGPALNRSAVDASSAGEQAADYYSAGGAGHCQCLRLEVPLASISRRAAEAGVEVLTSAGGTAEALEAARAADAVVVLAGATSTEQADRSTLALDDGADELISAVAKLRPTAVLMQTPGAVLTPWRGEVSAVANLFLAGQETGKAWAAVLFGDAEPAGRLPVMFPASEEDAILPEFYIQRVPYSEGRFTSYRSPRFQAAFPFGHGLSYTNFSYSRPRIVRGPCRGEVCLSFSVTNTGRRAGREVAQAYLEFPAEAGMPRLLLKAFHKTSTLKPGQAEEVSFAFSARDLSSYDPAAGWRAWEGVKAHLGASSADLRLELLLSKAPAQPAQAPAQPTAQPAALHRKLRKARAHRA